MLLLLLLLSHFSCVWLFVALWTIVCQAPLSMEFSRQEYWSGLPFPSPGDLPDPGIEPRSPAFRQILYHLAAAAAAKSLQSCPTLCNPIDGSPPGPSVHWILQARVLEWVAISFSNAWKWSHSGVSNSEWPHGLQPTRPLRPWDSPGKNTGVGCHSFLQCMKVKTESEVAQLCPTPSDPMDCSPPGPSVHGIFQARVLEWGAIAFSALPP